MHKFLCAVLFAAASLPASAASALGQAQISAFFYEQFMVVASEHCQGQEPSLDDRLHEAVAKFRGNLGIEIAAGRIAVSQLAAGRGQTAEQVALELARKSINDAIRGRGADNMAETCTRLAQEITSKAEWSIDDFLSYLYDDMMRDVGNTQGYPCDWLRKRADRAVETFVRGQLNFSEEKAFARFLVMGEVSTVLRFIDNCERAQNRAGEFRVTALTDYAMPKEALILIDKALSAFGSDRQDRLLTVIELLKSYRPVDLK